MLKLGVWGLLATLILIGTGATHAAPIHSTDHVASISAGLTRPSRLSLDGVWRFQTDPGDIGLAEDWATGTAIKERTVLVPLPWELIDPSLRKYAGVAWYAREFTLDPALQGRRITFGSHGIAEEATVFINGKQAGKHVGSQTPFLIDITEHVTFVRPNTIAVRVFNPATGVSYFLDHSSLLNISGMWRSAWIEATSSEAFIGDIFMIPDVDANKALARVTFIDPAGALAKQGTLQLTLEHAGKRMEHTLDIELERGSGDLIANQEYPVPIKNAKLWSPDHPHLYNVNARLLDSAGTVLDEVNTRFGMRKMETRDGRFYLNNQPIYLFGGGVDPNANGGAGDVNWFLPGPYRYPTPEENDKDLQLMKSIGFNFLRAPLRAWQPDLIRSAADIGLMAVEENSWKTAIASQQELLDTWSAIVLRDRNNPAVVQYALFNEGWGYREDWANALYDHVKQLDPTRLIIENTGGIAHNRNYPGNFRKTDIEDLHRYPGFNLFPRDYWMSQRYVQYPLIAGEFGPIPYLFNPKAFREGWGGDVWWMETIPPTQPPEFRLDWEHRGIEKRYTDWGLDKIYGDWDAAVDAHDWLYFWGIKDQTQAMRMNPDMSGFLLWGWDNGQHATGVITNFKQKKIFADELAKIWTPDAVTLDERISNYWGGERAFAVIHVSHFSQRDLTQGAKVEYGIEGTDAQGEMPVRPLTPGQEGIVGDMQLKVPDVEQPLQRKLWARLTDKTGKVLSENFEPIFLYPRKDCQPTQVPFGVHEISGPYWGAVHAFGSQGNYGYKYQILSQQLTTPTLAVFDRLDDYTVRYAAQGGTAIALVDKDSPLLELNGIRVVNQALGGHCDSYYAKKGLGIFDRVPYQNPYTWSFRHIWAKNALLGLKPEQHVDILSGGYMNLLNKQVATTAQFKVGKGRLIVTTLNLLEHVAMDPAAVMVFNGLLEYGAGDFEPGTELRLPGSE